MTHNIIVCSGVNEQAFKIEMGPHGAPRGAASCATCGMPLNLARASPEVPRLPRRVQRRVSGTGSNEVNGAVDRRLHAGGVQHCPRKVLGTILHVRPHRRHLSRTGAHGKTCGRRQISNIYAVAAAYAQREQCRFHRSFRRPNPTSGRKDGQLR